MNEEHHIERTGIMIENRYGELTRRLLIEKGLLDRTLKILKENDHLVLPLKDSFSEVEILKQMQNLEVPCVFARYFFEPVTERVAGDYRKLITGLNEELRLLLPNSFDVVGDLCIIKLRDEVQPYSDKIAQAIMTTVPSIKGVFHDLGVSGKFRIRTLHTIGGVKRTTTEHREYGMKLKVDIAHVYFSPRLAGERFRIATLVERNSNVVNRDHGGPGGETGGEAGRERTSERRTAQGECILDMFAGVGPFVIGIARICPSSIIHAVDSNPWAVELMKENIALNKVTNILPHFGDAQEITRELSGKIQFQRIIMNLPHHSTDFLESALDALDSGTIHLYSICEKEDLPALKSLLEETITRKEKKLVKILGTELKGYSPTEAFYVHDLEIH